MFLNRAAEYTRVNGPMDGAALQGLFGALPSIDIWFSTEGTLGPVTAPVFLDGDLLSARNGLASAMADYRIAILEFRLDTGTLRVTDEGHWSEPGLVPALETDRSGAPGP